VIHIPFVIHTAAIAELLICEAEASEGHREQAYCYAAHEAFMWPEDATTILAAGRSLQEFTGIGPSLAKRLHGWIVSPATFEVPVYSESCDLERLAEIEEDESKAVEIWSRRIKCIVACDKRPSFSSWGTRCFTDGKACGCGHQDCESV
jgi:hypothetical protein